MAVTYQQFFDFNWLEGGKLFINKMKIVTTPSAGGSIVGANAALTLLGP